MVQKSFFLLGILFAAPLCADLPLKCLSLCDAEQIALEYNKQLLIAQEETTQAKDRKNQAISRWLPSVFYYAEVRQVHPKELFLDVFSSQFPFSNEGYSSIFQMNQSLFSTDLIFNLRSKIFEERQFRYEQAQTKNELLLAVRKRFYAVLFFENALEIERANIDYFAFALEQEQGRLDAGNATPFEVNQSKVAVANAISLYYTVLKDLKNARNALVLTLGIDPLLEPEIQLQAKQFPIASIPELSLKIQELEQESHYSHTTFPETSDFLKQIDRLGKARKLTLFSEREVEEYLNLALSLRPDLLAKKMEIEAADQNLKAKQGSYLPQISGYARYSYNDDELGTVPFGQEEYNWAIGVTLNWNLFDGMLRENKIKEARSIRSATQIGYSEELQRIEVEIRNGLYQLEETLLSYMSSTQAVFLAEQARDQAKDKLQFGRIAPLEYRDSVNQLSQAKNQQNRASFDLISSYYQLRYASGIDTE